MPELAIANDKGELSLLAPLITVGIMHFPDDYQAARAYAICLRWNEIAEALADPDNDAMRAETARLGWTQDAWFWQANRMAMQTDELLEKAAGRRKDGLTAGNILLEAVACGIEEKSSPAAEAPQDGSINRIIAGMERPRRGRTTIMAAWGTHKAVAPLWAAVLVFLDHPELLPTPVPADVRLIGDEGWAQGLDDAERRQLVWSALGVALSRNLPLFLSVAERFRLFGEEQRTPHRRSALFSPGECFSPPPALGIEPAALEFRPRGDQSNFTSD